MLSRSAGRARSALVAGVAAGVIAVALLIMAAVGASQARRGGRVLGALTPVVEGIATSGAALTALLAAHGEWVGWAVTVVAGGTAVVGLLVRRRRALPLLLAGAAISLVSWGEVLLLADRVTAGVVLYGVGVLCAVGLGVWCPMAWWPGGSDAGRRAPFRGLDGVLVVVLTVGGLLARTYALNELPAVFEAENIASMLASRSVAGLRLYIPWALLGMSNGLVHFPIQLALYHVFGTSVFALRLTGVVFAAMLIPLFYWLVRRFAGTAAAAIATLLLVTAPEQLYWSRLESTAIGPIALLAVVSAHLGLWLVRRYSVAAVTANAVWLPFTRYFYTAGVSMMLYPWLLYVHAMVFVRGAWRTAWYVLPLLVGGTLLWVYSLSAVNYALTAKWRFLNPAQSGETIGRRPGVPRNATAMELARLQAESAVAQLGEVAKNLTVRTTFSPWYERVQSDPHPTVINVGVVVVATFGLGYLLGQIAQPQAFALAIWVAVGLLPGVLSVLAAERRICLIFPALYAIAGISIVGVLRLVRDCGGRVAAAVAGVGVAVGLVGVLWLSLASHYLLRTAPLQVEDAFRFVAPLFETSDTIYHDLDPTTATLLVFGHADRFVEPGRTPCFQFVAPRDQLRVALRHPCECEGEQAVRFALTPEEIAALRSARTPQRIGFLLGDDEQGRGYLRVLRELFPDAQERRHSEEATDVRLITLTVDEASTEALRMPVLAGGSDDAALAGLETTLLRDVRLRRVPASGDAEHDGRIVVRGGLLLERDGWYALSLEPACPEAVLRVDGEAVAGGRLRPLLAGVHAFEITLSGPVACPLPLQVQARFTDGRHPPEAAPSPLLVSPAVTAVAAAAAPEALSYAGYAEPEPFGDVPGTVIDFGVDSEGGVHVLTDEAGVYWVRRFDRDGRQLGAWQPQLPSGHPITVSVMGRDGSWFFGVGRNAWVYDGAGQLRGAWTDRDVTPSGIGLLPDGHVLAALPSQAAIALLRPDGTVERAFDRFEGGPGKFFEPVALALGPTGELLVVQTDGVALLFRMPPDRFEPELVRSFRMTFREPSTHARGTTFAAADRIVLIDPTFGAKQVYHRDGRRMMAADPARDLDAVNLGSVLRFQAAGDRLYALDGDRKLWVIPAMPPDVGPAAPAVAPFPALPAPL